MKCWKGLGGFVPFLVRHMSRSGNRDQIAAALGKVRDLQGEVGLNEPFTDGFPASSTLAAGWYIDAPEPFCIIADHFMM